MRKSCHVSGFIGKDPNSKVFVKQRVADQSRKSKRAETLLSYFRVEDLLRFSDYQNGAKAPNLCSLTVDWLSFSWEKLYGHDEFYYLEFCQSVEFKRLMNWGWIASLHARRFWSLEEVVSEAEIPDDFQNFMKTRMDVKNSDFKEILKKVELIECQELSVI